MTLPGLLLSLSIAQNVVLVHFLGVRPLPAVVASPRRAIIVSLATTIALVWVGMWTWLVDRLILAPTGAWYLQTSVIALVMGLSMLLAIRIASLIAPFARHRVAELTPTIFINATVFVVTTGLVEAELPFGWVVAGAAAAGLGLLIALVPIAAIVRHLSDSRIPRLLRGDASVFLALAMTALAVQQVDRLLARLLVPIF